MMQSPIGVDIDFVVIAPKFIYGPHEKICLQNVNERNFRAFFAQLEIYFFKVNAPWTCSRMPADFDASLRLVRSPVLAQSRVGGGCRAVRLWPAP